jgi:uncharacterized membrane protein YphA (DoxX/SURF4 family)
MVPIFLLPIFLFSGLFKNTGNLPDWIGWIQYISPLKYSLIAFVKNEVLYASKSKYDSMNFDVSMWLAVGLLIIVGMGFRILSLFFLWALRTKLQ